MQNKELKQHIQYISEALEASNQAFFSGLHMILAGIGILFIPLIEWVFLYVLNFKLWQHYTQIPTVNITLHFLFYWFMFYLIHRFADYITGQKTVLIGHPLIQKAFDVHKPIVYSILGIVIVFLAMDYGQLIFPMVFILLGIMLNLYGSFSTKVIYYTSWSFILVGLVGVLISKVDVNYLWMIGTSYLGLSYMVMGYSCKRKASSNE